MPRKVYKALRGNADPMKKMVAQAKQ